MGEDRPLVQEQMYQLMVLAQGYQWGALGYGLALAQALRLAAQLAPLPLCQVLGYRHKRLTTNSSTLEE